MSVEGLGTLRRALEKDSSSNKQVFSSRLDKGQEGGKDSNRLKQLTGDDYFMGNELGNLGRSSKGHCQFEKGKKKEYLKIGLRANHLESQ